MAGARRDAADANSESDVNSESRLIYSAAEKPAMRWDSHLTTHHHMPVQESIKVALLHWFTVRVAALALVAPYLCHRFDILGHTFDPSLTSLLIATPAAFSISAAYGRRERALNDLAELRAHALSLHRAFGLYGTPEQAIAGQRAVRETFKHFLAHLSSYAPEPLEAAYGALQSIAEAVEHVRLGAPPSVAPHIETIVGRMLMDERNLLKSVETLRLVRSFRTPTVLRGFLLAATTLFPILFAPYFAHAAHESDGPVWPAYVLSVGMAVANAVLVNIQKALEDPFDGDTADDIELTLFEPTWEYWAPTPVVASPGKTLPAAAAGGHASRA